MSTTIPTDDGITVGHLEHNPIPIITNGGNHQCVKWTIDGIRSHVVKKEYLKSPIFTVFDKNECKWYLTVQCIQTNVYVFSSLNLVLDRKSDCKEVVAKFKISIPDPFSITHECNLEPSKTFKFATNFDNKTADILRLTNSTSDTWPGNCIKIACEIRIETIFYEYIRFSNDFGYLLKNQLFADTVISVGEKKYPVHKVILAGRSSVFAAMFAHDMTEKKGIVHIEDIGEDVVEEMLSYIYTGKVEKLENLAQDLLIAADKYCLEGLRIMCENTLAANLSGSNALDTLVFAKRYNSNELKSQTIDFILSRRTKIKKTKAWESLDESDFEILKALCEGFLDFSNSCIAEQEQK